MIEINPLDLSAKHEAKQYVHAAALTRTIARSFPGVRHGIIHAHLSDVVAEIKRHDDRVQSEVGGANALVKVSRWLADDWFDLVRQGVGARVLRDSTAKTTIGLTGASCAILYHRLLNELIFEAYDIT